MENYFATAFFAVLKVSPGDNSDGSTCFNALGRARQGTEWISKSLMSGDFMHEQINWAILLVNYFVIAVSESSSLRWENPISREWVCLWRLSDTSSSRSVASTRLQTDFHLNIRKAPLAGERSLQPSVYTNLQSARGVIFALQSTAQCQSSAEKLFKALFPPHPRLLCIRKHEVTFSLNEQQLFVTLRNKKLNIDNGKYCLITRRESPHLMEHDLCN